MGYQELVDLFYAALQAHASEEEAYKDVEWITREAVLLGFSLITVTDAYVEAERA